MLASTCSALHSEYLAQIPMGGAAGLTDASLRPVCELQELPTPSATAGTCRGSQEPGWCYLTGAAAGICPQAVVFTASAVPPSAVILLSCTD